MNRNARIWEHCLEQASLSHIGMRRANNQDSKVVVLASSPEKWLQRGHLFMVADGMGAHAAGELASKLATDAVPLTYQKLTHLSPPDALREATEEANRQIHARGTASADFRGMGTTASVLVLVPQGALVAHVGDSRAYRHRGERLEQLTFDHSLVWEIRAAGTLATGKVPDYVPKNVITRSLGPNPTVRVDVEGPFPLEVGDTFLLCSDGLSGQVTDEEIGTVLGCMPPEEAVEALVDLANLRGGPDNITVVVARVTGPEMTKEGADTMPLPSSDSGRGWARGSLWALCAVLAVAAFGLGAAAAQFGAFWLGVVAAGCAVGAVVSGVSASTSTHGDETPAPRFDGRPLGRGPYVACGCQADASFAGHLAGTVQQLRRLADEETWPVDWDRFHSLMNQAIASHKAEDFVSAVRGYCRAIRCLMSRMKNRRDRG